MELLTALLALVAFSVLSFWQGTSAKTCVLWLITAAISIVTGIFFFVTYRDFMGITFTLVLIVYTALCIGLGYNALIRGHETEE